MIHNEKHSQAGQHVTVHPKYEEGSLVEGAHYVIEDWWDRLAEKSWMFCTGNPACLNYGMRSGFGNLPTDNEVVYGHVITEGRGPSLGYLVHISELGDVVQTN